MHLCNKKLQKNEGLGNLKSVKIILFCSFVIVIFPVKAVLGGEQLSNIKVIDRLLMVSFDSLEINRPVDHFSFGALQDQQRSYLQNYLVHHFNTEARIGNLKNGTMELHVEQFETNIVYVPRFSLLPWKSDSLQRHVHISLSGWVKPSGTNPLVAINFARSYMDKIIAGEQEKVEKSNYLFSRGRLQDQGVWSKVTEPLLVLSAIAGMVYLFFTVRS